jgi:transposase
MSKYNIAIRTHAMKLVKKYGVCETARRMCISRTTIWRWKKNGIEPKKRIYKLVKFEEIRDRMWSFITAVKCVNVRMVQAAMKEVHGVDMSRKTVCKYIKKLGLSRKRVSARGTSKLATPERIAEYKNAYMRAVEHGRTLVSFDECGFSERVKALYGYSPVGKPCIVHNSGSWHNHTLLMAVFSTGRKEYFIFNGPVDKSAFQEFIEYLALDETHVIIADNASIHKYMTLRRNRAEILYTPPYEPDSNPIELCFSQVKGKFRELNTMLRPDVLALVSDSVEAAATGDLVISCFRHVYDDYVMQP